MQNFSLIKTKGYINGAYVENANRQAFAVLNPATQQEICQVADLGVTETKQAILAAEQAQKRWKQALPKERANILIRWYELVLQHQEELAQIISLEQGKPITESRGEVLYGASFIQWFAEEAKRIQGDMLPSDKSNHRLMAMKQPVGVVAAITPWNFPNAMITRKSAPALAAGCAVVLKPAPETPLSALALAELASQAGLPKGLLNVIPTTQSVEVGKVLTESPIIRKLTFTGSTKVGKLLMAQSVSTVKKLSLELGGNAPALVFDDADLDSAVEGVFASKFRNAGQTCICTNRIYVQAGIYEAFMQKFCKKVQQIKLGEANKPNVTMGPLIRQSAVEKVQRHIDDALQKGAKLVLGGKPADLGGTFFQPTVLKEVNQTMLVAKEETFAPLAPIFKFETEEQAIAMANDTEFGLAAYFFTQNINRIWRVSEALEYGIVGINEGLVTNEFAPFGGVKESGIGREGSHYGIDEFLELKYLCLGIK
ncbi:NAD-dependent succinate-semialdehyde dehydrogenase [Avibacterium avium]|uniref:NAD-dependent succinate-semialdehyde dehydrogenase n=1 Tax=Avibacterium avium TaxID=751 RepID=UPI003BF83FC8